MKTNYCFPIFLVWLALSAAGAAGAATYPSVIGFELPLAAPKLSSLTAALKTTQGTVGFDLKFTYDGGAGFACAPGSTVDGQPANCTARQNHTAYTLTATVPADGTRITLAGKAGAGTAQATYKGPKGRLAGRRATVAGTLEPVPVVSRVVLIPEASGRRLGGTGRVDSGYGAARPGAAITGTVTKSKVAWSLKYPTDRLSFSGKEAGEAWVGRLTGKLGPAKVAVRVTIPLRELTYPLSLALAGTGGGRVASTPAGLDCPGACEGPFPYGNSVGLAATAAAGSVFAGWSGDEGCAQGQPSMLGPRRCVATFNLQQTVEPRLHGLDIQLAGTGSGRVASTPAGLDCPGACSASFEEGRPVSLAATAAAGSVFVGWSGDESCAEGQPAMLGPRRCVARFNLVPVGDARFHGTVSTTDGRSAVLPAEGVTVAIHSDLNGNGAADPGETVSGKTGANGAYALNYPAVSGRPVVVDFTLDGYSKTPKVYASVTPGSDVSLNTTLRSLTPLTMLGTSAAAVDGSLRLQNLPPTVASIAGLVLNPVTDTAQFPGEFADSDGNLLISTVFAAIEAKDAEGKPVRELAPDTTVRMQVPKETWATLRDRDPDTAPIEVPLYFYDEGAGQWKSAAPDGWLEDSSGNKLDRSILPIDSSTYAGPIYAVATITHLSYWNIDWPVSTHGCVAGRVVDSTGNPVAGAVVVAKGVTYTGTSSPRTTDAAGRFCITVMRSEAPGEDVDRDGATGETTRIKLSVQAGGKHYDFDPYDMPTAPATCPSSGCLQLRDLILDPARAITVSQCTINGKLVYSGTWTNNPPPLNPGDPIANAMVTGFDPDAGEASIDCLVNDQNCTLWANSDAQGQFTLRFPILFGAQLYAYSFGGYPYFETADLAAQTTHPPYGFYTGNATTRGCPAEPLTIPLDFWGHYWMEENIWPVDNGTTQVPR